MRISRVNVEHGPEAFHIVRVELLDQDDQVVSFGYEVWYGFVRRTGPYASPERAEETMLALHESKEPPLMTEEEAAMKRQHDSHWTPRELQDQAPETPPPSSLGLRKLWES